MENDSKQEAYNFLSNMATQQGYVTFDDIIDVADKFQLPDAEIDWLSDQLSMWGILICEKSQDDIINIKETDEYSDYAQVDYESIFNKITKIEPSLIPLINAVKKIRPPQLGEFGSIVHKAKEGDRKARERILMMHLRCAIRIGFQRSEMYETELSECLSDAFEGLVRAFDKYDPYFSGPFVSYASMWIFQSLTRRQPNQRPSIYYPAHKKERYFTVFPILKNKGCFICEKKHSCKKALELICKKLNYTEENAKEIINQITPLFSYDNLLENYTKECSSLRMEFDFEDIFINKINEKYDPSYIFEQQRTQEEICAMLKTLSEREAKVIIERFGFENDEEKTLEEIGRELNITRERVRQIEAKALKKLMGCSRKKQIKNIIF